MASAPALLSRRVRSILSDGPNMSRWSRASRVVANLGLVAVTVAAMPRVNILFAEDAGGFLLQTAATPIEAHDTPAIEQRSSPVISHPRFRAIDEPVPDPIAASAIPAVAHDDALAAQHRAALGILTESTGMEPSGSSELRASVQAGEGPQTGARTSGASLETIAVDAAERMRPLMGRHDDDRH
jgi:hypothetical protein